MQVCEKKTELVLERRYHKLGYKCIHNKHDAVVDLERILGVVLSNCVNSLIEIDSSYLMSVYHICGTNILDVVYTFGLIIRHYPIREPFPYLGNYNLIYI